MGDLTKTEELKKSFLKVHGNMYDYSNVEFVKNNQKVTIGCREHGNFEQTVYKHLLGQGCPKCARQLKYKSTEDLVKAFRKTHVNEYDYSKVNFSNLNTKVEILCQKHGNFFQLPASHLKGQRSPECSTITRGLKRRSSKDAIIIEFKKIHGDLYDYSLVKYEGLSTGTEPMQCCRESLDRIS